MADKHPYMSGSAGLNQVVNQLRKSFPAQVASETLKKLGIAPNNETYIINILRFISILDEEGKKTQKASTVFTKHNDEDFQKGLSELVETAYTDLFSLHGKDSWSLSTDKLISYFRSADHTSAIVGERQARTFQALATLCGYIEVPTTKTSTTTRRTETKPKSKKEAKVLDSAVQELDLTENGERKSSRDMGLTVRIEINLPVAADQETYNRIFKSIRENLLNAE